MRSFVLLFRRLGTSLLISSRRVPRFGQVNRSQMLIIRVSFIKLSADSRYFAAPQSEACEHALTRIDTVHPLCSSSAPRSQAGKSPRQSHFASSLFQLSPTQPQRRRCSRRSSTGQRRLRAQDLRFRIGSRIRSGS